MYLLHKTEMATFFLHPLLPSSRPTSTISRRQLPIRTRRCIFRPCSNARRPDPSSTEETSRSENGVLKLAWYGSELLGIAASLFRRPSAVEEGPPALEGDYGSAEVARDQIVEAIKDDFRRSYFVTGNLSLSVYEENCEFVDPAGSFKGRRRFKRNCTNFGSLLLNSDMKLTKWEDFEDKGVGHWRFSCVMLFPWRPILSATGYTEYYFDSQSGKVCRHVENWNVPKMAVLKQIFRPSRWIWDKRANP